MAKANGVEKVSSPTWPCTWIGNSSPSRTRNGEDPELGVERADVAPADEGETDERDSTRGGYEPQVEREGGRLARHWSESRQGGTLQAWANGRRSSERPKLRHGSV